MSTVSTLYIRWCVFLWAVLYYCRGGGVLWLVSGQRVRIREGVAESSSIYSVCGGGCWAGTYNSNRASSSPDSQCTVFVFLLTKAFVFRRIEDGSYIFSVEHQNCYHKMSENVWQQVFNKPKISLLHFNETLLDSPTNVMIVCYFSLQLCKHMHDTIRC